MTDVGQQNITLGGPKHLVNTIMATRYFLVRPRLKVVIREFSNDKSPPSASSSHEEGGDMDREDGTQPFVDENIRLVPIIVEPPSSGRRTSDKSKRGFQFEYNFYPTNKPKPTRINNPTSTPAPTTATSTTSSKSNTNQQQQPQPKQKQHQQPKRQRNASTIATESTSKEKDNQKAEEVPPRVATATMGATITSDPTQGSVDVDSAIATEEETAWMKYNMENEVINLRSSMGLKPSSFCLI